MIALWDLGTKPWTWDFFTGLVIMRERFGAIGIDFRLRGARSTKWPMEESLKRFDNYLRPGPQELAGMSVTVDRGGIETNSPHTADHLPKDFSRLALRDQPPPAGIDYTVTIRNTFHRVDRNSDQKVWREFARRIGAYVIEDSRDEPISLRKRFCFYANARMNYGVPNGPVSVIGYTNYPVCIVSDPNNADSNKAWTGCKIKAGDRPRWLLDNQHLIWEKPTIEGLLALHERIAA